MKAVEVLTFFGLTDRSLISHASKNGNLDKWLKEHDPDGRPWTWKGEGRNRRYFRGGDD